MPNFLMLDQVFQSQYILLCPLWYGFVIYCIPSKQPHYAIVVYIVHEKAKCEIKRVVLLNDAD